MASPLLLADIGGTNARFALLEGGAPGAVTSLALDDFPDIGATIAAALQGRAVRGALLAVAGPVSNNQAVLTNRGWRIDGGVLKARVINDFEALAWALPALKPEDVLPLGGAPRGQPGAPLAVLGPGTGLGVAAFVPPGQVLPGEGGHASLAAGDEREAAVVALLRRRHGHCSAERVLSGPGLAALHDALAELDGQPPPGLSPAEVIAAAPDTLALFCAMLGGFAGNVALTYGARGGVFLAGGVLPRLPQALAASAFRDRFEAKGRMQPYLAAIPTALITRPDPALLGLARAARHLGV